MADPNIASASSIHGGYVAASTTTTLTSLLSVTADSNKVYKIDTIYASCSSSSNQGGVDICISDGVNDRYIAKNVQVPPESTQIILNRSRYFYLQEGESIKVSGYNTHVIVVYDDIYTAPGVITDGLIFHVDAADSASYSGSGTTWTDISGQGNDMTLNGSPTHTSGSGGYFQFDGTTSEYANVSLSDFNSGHNPISIEAWVNIDDTDSDYRHIFGARDTGSNNFGFYMLLMSSSNVYKMEARLETTTTTDIVYNLGSHWNSWRQLVFTWDPDGDNATRFYINGSLIQTGSTNTNSFGTAADFTVAKTSGGSYPTQMKGSKFLVYTKTLSANEVLNNYNYYKDEFGL